MVRNKEHKPAKTSRYLPVRSPVIEIGRDLFMILNYYDFETAHQPNTMILERMTRQEVEKLDRIACYGSMYGELIVHIRKRLGIEKAHLEPVIEVKFTPPDDKPDE